MQLFTLLSIYFFALISAALALPEYTAAASPLSPRLIVPLVPLSPTEDPFYVSPSNLGSFSRGEVIRSRAVSTADDTSNAASVYQVLYRTTNALGLADSTVATLFAPLKPASTPNGKAKVWALAIPSDSASLECQPSYSLIKGSLSKARLALLPSIFASSIQTALGKGWYVVVPDYLGSTASWMAGEQTGRAYIDGMRAFFDHKPTFQGTLEEANIVMFGYSGGAAASSWAARLLSTYGKDLPVKGIFSGGIPADLTLLISTLNKRTYAGFIFAAIAGVSSAYSDLEDKLRSKFTPQGVELLRSFRQNKCLPDILLGNAGRDVFDYTVNEKVFEQEDVKEALHRNSLNYGAHRFVPSSIPQWIVQSQSDEIIDARQVDSYVTSQCANGANIRYTTYDGPSHIGMALAGLSSAYVWMDAAFEERTGQTECSREDAFPKTKLSDVQDQQIKQLTQSNSGPLKFNF